MATWKLTPILTCVEDSQVAALSNFSQQLADMADDDELIEENMVESDE